MTRAELIESLREKVDYLAASLHRRLPASVLQKELASAGWLGAIRAVDHWEPERGKLETFAEWPIRGAMLDYLRLLDPMSRDDRRHHKADPEHTEGCVVLSIEDIKDLRGKADRSFAQVEAAADVEALTSAARLTTREQAVLRGIFYEDLTGEAVGRLLGVGQARTSQIKHAALAKLRNASRPRPQTALQALRAA
jgi:RNA polymerase sigma factor (sigma-70 family)